MLRVLSVVALASAYVIAAGALVHAQGMPSQGMPMGSMKTTKDVDDKAIKEAPNEAQAPAPERVRPTYRDTAEDRLMREKTDDGAHDRDDTLRQQ
jgi:hypothetical protein